MERMRRIKEKKNVNVFLRSCLTSCDSPSLWFVQSWPDTQTYTFTHTGIVFPCIWCFCCFMLFDPLFTCAHLLSSVFAWKTFWGRFLLCCQLLCVSECRLNNLLLFCCCCLQLCLSVQIHTTRHGAQESSKTWLSCKNNFPSSFCSASWLMLCLIC